MNLASPVMTNALASLRGMLAADGYELVLGEDGPDSLVIEIRAGADACADCLVPKALMQTYFEQALRPVCEFGLPEIRLVYPSDAAPDARNV